jgi:hypothetical protein
MPHRLKILVLAAILICLNLWLVHELLVTEYVNQMGSIEGTHIAVARFALEHAPDLWWFPLWYGGIPYQNAYPPLHPLLVAGAAKLFGLSPALAYHALTAIFYSLGPVTLFWLALRLSRSPVYSFAAALIYSLVSPSAFLMPSVRGDMGGLLHARRLEALVHYGEGPHIASMTLVPVALVTCIVAFDKRRPIWWILAAAAMISVFLTNWLGGFALIIAVAAWLMARDGLDWRRWMTALGLAVYGYLMVCSWMPPSTILTARVNESLVPVSGWAARWGYIAVGLAAAALLLWALLHFKAPLALRFSLLFLLPIAWLVLSNEWAGVRLLGQVHRLHLEMEMGVVLVAAFGSKLVLDRFPPRVRAAVACSLAVLAILPAVAYRRYAKKLTRPVDIRRTIEYREAQWLAANLGGQRVDMPGSVGFFLNVFTDTPQFGGGFYQGIVNPSFREFDHQIRTGENAGSDAGRVAVLALQAFGVDAIGVSGPRSHEAYKPFLDPGKFEGPLHEIWRDGDDAIYRVPRRSTSLAHVIRLADLPPRTPRDGLDIKPLLPYVRALEDPSLPLAAMDWTNQHAARISARMEKGQILSVQVSYHPGWNAFTAGRRLKTFGDHLGQLVIEPDCAGPCTVDISYDGGIEMRIARIVSWSALAAGIAWILFDWRRRRITA